MRIAAAIAGLSVAFVLAACGGGGGGGGDSGVPQQITGTVAAANGPFSGTAVTLKDASGRSASANTATDGTFQISTEGLTPPFLLSSTQSSQTLFGYSAQGSGVANLNPYTTAILQAYYLASGTTVPKVFGGTITPSNIPDATQIDLLTAQVLRAIQPYLANAGVASPQTFNPFRAAYASGSTGFAQVVANTTVAPSLLTITANAASGKIAGQSTSVTMASGGPAGGAVPASPDLVTFTTVTNIPGSSAPVVSTFTVNMCRSGGTPIPGAPGYFDCVAKMTFDPGTINIAAGGELLFSVNTPTNDQVNPAILAFDAAGYPTPIPQLGKLLQFSLTGAAITVTPSTVTDGSFPYVAGYQVAGYPFIHAHNLGTSQLKLTDSVTQASAALTVIVIMPKLFPDPLDIDYPYPLESGPVKLVDGDFRPVVGPSDFTLDSDKTFTVAGVSSSVYPWRDGFVVSAVGPGIATLTGEGIFGNLGFQTLTSTVCVKDASNIGCKATTTTVTANPPILPAEGGTVVLTAFVTPDAASPIQPMGTVTFLGQSGATLCIATALASGSATCTATIASVPFSVTATYSGDKTYRGGSGSTTVVPSSGSCTWTGVLSGWVPTTISGTYTATGVQPPGIALDSGSFSGTVKLDPFSCPPFFVLDINALTLNSSLYGSSYYTVPEYGANDFGLVMNQAGESAICQPQGCGSAIGIEAAGTANTANCDNIVWASGPLAGQPGTSSTGSGRYLASADHPSAFLVLYEGTCSVTVR